jgi:hypothetical protein
MPALLPVLVTATHVILVADRVPELNIEPSCRAATTSAVTANRTEDACKQDEQRARDQLQKQWASFEPAQKARCTSLSHRGGSPSYVELLTCLEVAKSAKELPEGAKMKGDAGR